RDRRAQPCKLQLRAERAARCSAPGRCDRARRGARLHHPQTPPPARGTARRMPTLPVDLKDSILGLVLEASLLVQIVLGILAAASVVSWAIILRKRRALRATRSAAESFETVFWSGGDLGALYRTIESRREKATGMESIFEFGFREF